MTATKELLRKRAVTSRGDPGQGLLAALAVLVLTASAVSIGTIMVILARTVPRIIFAMPGRFR
jgi:hypothetical protein